MPCQDCRSAAATTLSLGQMHTFAVNDYLLLARSLLLIHVFHLHTSFSSDREFVLPAASWVSCAAAV
jgi:hypothetical protein